MLRDGEKVEAEAVVAVPVTVRNIIVTDLFHPHLVLVLQSVNRAARLTNI